MGSLSLLVFLPLLALGCSLLPLPSAWLNRISAAVALSQTLLACFLLAQDSPEPGFALAERLPWIRIHLGAQGVLALDYYLAADGISLTLSALSGLVLFVGIVVSREIRSRERAFYALISLLSISVQGCFLSRDFFLFFLFFEFLLLPMLFLIGIWGGERKEYAAVKFFIYTLAGSVLILGVMAGWSFSFVDPEATARLVQEQTGIFLQGQDMVSWISDGKVDPSMLVHSLSLDVLENPSLALPGSMLHPGTEWDLGFHLVSARWIAFLLMFIAFGIKLPVVPLHTWLPDAHVQAPTGVSVILAGILLKVGSYGLFRMVFGLFPDQFVLSAGWLAAFGAISIVYAGLNAMAQKDLKSLIAYSSISHMGFCLLGLASMQGAGVTGGILQMVTHGIISPMLFILVGVLYSRTHDRQIASYTGLWNSMPSYTGFVILAFFASLGLPGLCGFIAEMLVLTGAFNGAYSGTIGYWTGGLAILGIVIGAAYYILTLRRMFFGTWAFRGDAEYRISDLEPSEWLVLLLLGVPIILIGIYPNIILTGLEADAAAWLQHLLDQARMVSDPLMR